MDNKIILAYENNEYKVTINDNEVFLDKDLDKAFERFKKVIKDNATVVGEDWDGIVKSLDIFDDSRLEINNEFKTIAFGVMKYFHATGKLFYVGNGQMQPITGGIHTFRAIVEIAVHNYINNYEELLQFITEVLKSHATFRASESSLFVNSAAFHYGSAEFNFISNKINKGATIESGDFSNFKEYVLKVLAPNK